MAVQTQLASRFWERGQVKPGGKCILPEMVAMDINSSAFNRYPCLGNTIANARISSADLTGMAAQLLVAWFADSQARATTT